MVSTPSGISSLEGPLCCCPLQLIRLQILLFCPPILHMFNSSTTHKVYDVVLNPSSLGFILVLMFLNSYLIVAIFL